MTACRVETVDAPEALRLGPRLAEILRACVTDGASVSFMDPLSPERALAFWTATAEAAARRERILLVAFSADGEAIGTVQLVLAMPENQPHRADVSKLLVHPDHRRAGAGEALMRAVERAAAAAGRTLLVLDTASAAADRLYRRLGWTCAGRIPEYALNPDGSPTHTDIFWKRLDAS